MTPIRMLTLDEKIAEIRRLYFATTKETINQDLDTALGLLKSMGSDDERDRAAVYMDGMMQMRNDWGRGGGRPKPKQAGAKGAKGANSARRPATGRAANPVTAAAKPKARKR